MHKSVYRYAIGQWLGDAHTINNPSSESSSTERLNQYCEQSVKLETQSLGEMLLIKKLGKEFLIKTRDIEWAEACGNYINLRIANEFYPMRITMTEFISRSAGLRIARAHKSYAVNLNFVHSIESKNSGDAEIIMQSEQRIRLSRRYKSAFEAALPKILS